MKTERLFRGALFVSAAGSVVLETAVGRARVGGVVVRWQGATRRRAAARNEEQRRQRAAALLNRARSGVTHEVMARVGRKVCIHAVFPAEESGQLRFQGSSTSTRLDRSATPRPTGQCNVAPNISTDSLVTLAAQGVVLVRPHRKATAEGLDARPMLFFHALLDRESEAGPPPVVEAFRCRQQWKYNLCVSEIRKS